MCLKIPEDVKTRLDVLRTVIDVVTRQQNRIWLQLVGQADDPLNVIQTNIPTVMDVRQQCDRFTLKGEARQVIAVKWSL